MSEIDRAEVERVKREHTREPVGAAAAEILDSKMTDWESVAWYLAGALVGVKKDRRALERVASQGMHGSPAVPKTPRVDGAGDDVAGDGI